MSQLRSISSHVTVAMRSHLAQSLRCSHARSHAGKQRTTFSRKKRACASCVAGSMYRSFADINASIRAWSALSGKRRRSMLTRAGSPCTKGRCEQTVRTDCVQRCICVTSGHLHEGVALAADHHLIVPAAPRCEYAKV